MTQYGLCQVDASVVEVLRDTLGGDRTDLADLFGHAWSGRARAADDGNRLFQLAAIECRGGPGGGVISKLAAGLGLLPEQIGLGMPRR